jgi:hypothetical protein
MCDVSGDLADEAGSTARSIFVTRDRASEHGRVPDSGSCRSRRADGRPVQCSAVGDGEYTTRELLRLARYPLG